MKRTTPLRSNPEKLRAWRERSVRRYQENRARTRINSVSAKRKAENRVRRRVLHETYGTNPPCFLCPLLAEHGVVTGCNGWATDGDERLRRSAGGSITDPDNVRPVGRLCHDWIGAHPKLAREWGLVESRYGGAA